MKERPILFSSPMVRAILEGRKTMTRRVVKPQPTGEQRPLSEWSRGLAEACHDHLPDVEKLAVHSERIKGRIFPFTTENGGLMSPTCPYGIPGNRLWVRESFRIINGQTQPEIEVDYKATTPDGYRMGDFLGDPQPYKPSIHMPRRLSRILLEITNVRVERLQDIKRNDAVAEGCIERNEDGAWLGAEVAFCRLWESINGAGSWEENPWVWVVEFQRIKP